MNEEDSLSLNLEKMEKEYSIKYGRVVALNNNNIKNEICLFISQMNNILKYIKNNTFLSELKNINKEFAQFYNTYFDDFFLPSKKGITSIHNIYKAYLSNVLNLVDVLKNSDNSLTIILLNFLEKYLLLFYKNFN